MLTEVSCILHLYVFLASFMVSSSSFMSSFHNRAKAVFEFSNFAIFAQSAKLRLTYLGKKTSGKTKFHINIDCKFIVTLDELVAFNLLDYLQNNRARKIFDEVLSNKSEGLMLDMTRFLSLLEQYFCNALFSKICS